MSIRPSVPLKALRAFMVMLLCVALFPVAALAAPAAPAAPVRSPEVTPADGVSDAAAKPASLGRLTTADEAFRIGTAGDSVPGEMLVRFKPGATASARSAAVSLLGARAVRSFASVPGLQLVRIAPTATVEQVVAAASGLSSVAYAQPNYIKRVAASAPNDPGFDSQWALENNAVWNTYDADIDALAAWDTTTGAESVKIAIVDSGIAYDHPDLAANVWVNSGETSTTDGIDNDGNGYVDDWCGYDVTNDDNDPFDDFGHGTNVAGIIGAEANNGTGIAGVNVDVSLMAIKSFNASGESSTVAEIDAFAYADANGARIINNSWTSTAYDQVEYDAIAAMSDHLFVFPVGNDWGNDNDANPVYPASYDLANIVSVGNSDPNDSAADSSNHGATTTDVFAPGIDIRTTTVGTFDPESTVLVSQESVEQFNDLSNWTIGGNNLWSLDGVRYTSPPSSLRLTYGNSQSSSLTLNTPVDVSSGEAACLVLDMDLETELNFDYFDVYVTDDPASGWTSVWHSSGQFGDWRNDMKMPVPSQYWGTSTLYIRFSFYSDSSVVRPGVWIDDVEVWTGTVEATYDYTNAYDYMSGSSMSAAHVSGIAGLLSAYDDSLTADEMKSAIMAGVDVLPQLDGLCETSGRVNAYKALVAAGAAKTHGEITGTVTGDDGSVVAGAVVMSMYWEGETGFSYWDGYAVTDSNGDYAIAPVNPGQHIVHFAGVDETWVPEWYDNTPAWSDDFDLVDVAAGQTVQNIDAVLERWAGLHGTVTDTSGVPLSGIYIAIMSYDPDSDLWDYYDQTSTAPDGTWGYDQIMPRQYRLYFADEYGDYAFQWYDGAALFDDATTIDLGSGEQYQADVQMSEGGSISGTVMSYEEYIEDRSPAAAGGHPLGEHYVEAYLYEPGFYEYVPVGRTYTDERGHYTLNGLPAADVVVYFDGEDDHYDEIYDNRLIYGYGPWDAVTVEEGRITTGINARLGDYWDDWAPDAYTDAESEYLDQAIFHIWGEDDYGVEEIIYWVDGGAETRVKGSEATVTVDPSPGSGTSITNLAHHIVEYVVADYCGKRSETQTVDFMLETSDMSVPTISDDAQDSYYDEAAITLTAEDDTELLSISYQLDGGDLMSVFVDGTLAEALVEISEVGDHSLTYWAMDADFNESAHHTVAFEVVEAPEVPEDTEAPEATDDAVASYVGTATITITAIDDQEVAAVHYKLDDGDYVSVDGDTAVVTTTEIGEHALSYYASDAADNESDVATAEFEVTPDYVEGVGRVAGTDRYATAVAASQQAFPAGADTVVIATGQNWPDALSGAGLAGAAEGPLLLTPTDTLPSAVSTEVERLGASKAYVLGGFAAVSESVEASLVAMLGADNVERLSGMDRYGTSRAVAEETIEIAGDRFGGSAFVVTGADFPDALSASPAAANNCMPVLLAHPELATVALPSAVDEVVVLGGTGAVSAATEAALIGSLGSDNVERIGGTNRYATAALVAEASAADWGMSFDLTGIATGENFADALSGGAMMGAMEGVLLLTPTSALHPDSAASLEDHAEEISTVFILGGTGAVSQAVEDAVVAILE